jgi:hypothetical protein
MLDGPEQCSTVFPSAIASVKFEVEDCIERRAGAQESIQVAVIEVRSDFIEQVKGEVEE